MKIIPTQAVPAQTFTVQLGDQNCRIDIYQKSTGLFLDLYVSDTLIIGGVICRDANYIVKSAYLGFVGDLAFYDLQGESDPLFSGLGSRWFLAYIEASEIVV